MNKLVEVLLTALALAGMYCAMPRNAASSGNPVLRTGHEVLVADGSDPMPLCRGRKCGAR